MKHYQNLILLGLLGLASLPTQAEDYTFNVPQHEGFRIDVCYTWGQGCGQDAANAFCTLQGYSAAIAFEVDEDIGASSPTRTLGDLKVCDQPFCDGFRSITCTRPDSGRSSSTTSRTTSPAANAEVSPSTRVSPALLKALTQPGAPQSTVPEVPQPTTPTEPNSTPPEPPESPQPTTPQSTVPGTPVPTTPEQPEAPPQPLEPSESLKPWTTQDIIDGRIDVYAQYALMRMFTQDPVSAAAASAMLSAVKDGTLAGIYQPDQKVPALRAQSLGSAWWLLLPKGAVAICVVEPADKAPLIVFSKEAKGLSYQLDPALQSVWAECGIDWAAPRPYLATLPPKQPAVAPPAGQDTQLTLLVVGPANAPVKGAMVNIGAGTPTAGGSTNAAGQFTIDLPAGVWSVQIDPPQSLGGSSSYLAAQVKEGRNNLYTVQLGYAAIKISHETGEEETGHTTQDAPVLTPDCAGAAAACNAQCVEVGLSNGELCGGDPVCLNLEASRYKKCVAICNISTLSCVSGN